MFALDNHHHHHPHNHHHRNHYHQHHHHPLHLLIANIHEKLFISLDTT